MVRTRSGLDPLARLGIPAPPTKRQRAIPRAGVARGGAGDVLADARSVMGALFFFPPALCTQATQKYRPK